MRYNAYMFTGLLLTSICVVKANDIVAQKDKFLIDPMQMSRYSICYQSSTMPMLSQTHQHSFKQEEASKKRNMPLSKPPMTLLEDNQMIQRSWVASMVIPGLGQVYNKQYWKVLCIYGGLYLFGHIAYGQYREHRDANRHLYKAERSSTFRIGSAESAFWNKKIKEAARGRNLWMIITAFWYLINVLDAYAGANMRTFNLSDDIGLVIHPNITKNNKNMPDVGLNVGLNFNLK